MGSKGKACSDIAVEYTNPFGIGSIRVRYDGAQAVIVIGANGLSRELIVVPAGRTATFSNSKLTLSSWTADYG